ncbi:methyl-accepting chemotaxis protein [Sporomusa malonica]|uniref:Methyl-accepting chemotaxis sensory transducer with Cache sensor n=1 Tax=Sporomusa malonica TaxID=112901 RepID=A0A1W1YP95_9FIRM|nr:methyl-accepting chemotaxis protein [Sporomusa malonica]SMC38015.1 methyl-accepting chemotaxis sensory transducer with Cache sensor [Sporomusa malonica]
MKSIRIKLVVTVAALFVFALSLLAGLNYWQAKNIIIQDVEAELTNMSKNCSQETAEWLERTKSEIAGLARSPVITTGKREEIVPYLAAELNTAKIYESLIWIDNAGNYFDFKGETGTLAEREYFKRSIKGETVISDPVISKKTNNPIVIISLPIRNENRIIGVLAGAINIEAVEKLVLGVKTGETGYAYVIQGDGVIIFHPNKDIALKVSSLTDPNATPALKAATEKMTKGEQGLVSYEYLGVNKYLAYAPIKGTNWSLGVNVPVSEIIAKLNTFTWTSLAISIVVLILAIFVVFITATWICKPLKALESAANGIADGDLTVTNIDVHSGDELEHLSRIFETMVSNLRSLVQQINDSSQQVAASSQQLTANAEQSAQVAGQVAASITDTAQGVDCQVTTVDKALQLVEKIAAGAQEEAVKTENSIVIANKAVEAATAGNKAVDIAVSQMNHIRQTVETSSQVVAELGEQSKEIGQIVETISGIAAQTNLLALNAAIEAARAGEQGRGFAVVAEEVRKLAEQSQEAAKQIATLIGDIQGKTDKAVVAMVKGTQEVRRGSEVVDQAGQSFLDIDRHIKEVAAIAQGTASGMKQLVGSSQQVVESMQGVEHISREISSQTQTISAASEEQSASMEEIASSSHHLAQLAEQLQSAVNRFKL